MIEVLDIDEVEPGVGYVYRWVNLVNGKMYIGSHDGNDPRYTASGILIRKAFAKYGIDRFTRELLYIGENFRKEEERLLILVDAANNSEYYNLKNSAIGAGSGPNNTFYGKKHTPEVRSSLSAIAKGRGYNPMAGGRHSQESRDKMSRNTDVHGEKNPMFGHSWSAEQREAQSAKLRGRVMPADQRAKLSAVMGGEKNPFYGKTHSPEARERIASAARARPKLTCPYCPVTGSPSNMSRWHFDNCKQKEKGTYATTT